MIKKIATIIVIAFISLIGLLLAAKPAAAGELIAQQPTVAIPTVTGTPEGVTATVRIDQVDPINIRAGPGTLFDIVGVLLPRQTVSVSGRSVGGDWLMIDYPGDPGNFAWVYSPFMNTSPGELPIIEPPSTPTPEVTQTINPTLAAQFITTPNPTRMPTYTPGDPLVIPNYTDTYGTSFLGGVPMGLVIIILVGLGGLLVLFSFIRSR
jgi:uncharacterized protein YraI